MGVHDLIDRARAAWAQKQAHDAEWALWENVPDLAHLRELVAWFCEGKLSFTPGHAGPRDSETEGNVGEALAHANRSGFLTTNSQNGGENELSGQWRSDVSGLADDATVARLRALVAGTRLCLQAAPLKFFPQQGTVPGTHQKPDGSAYGSSPVLSWRDIAFQFPGIPDEVLSQVTRLNYVQIVDPKWGPSNLLWQRLSTPDWDNPPPPNEDRTMSEPVFAWPEQPGSQPAAVPTDEQVEHLGNAVDRAFTERDRLFDVWRATGTDEDYAAMEEQDRVADRLLTQYNAACQAQRAESDRRRDINVARHGRDQAVERDDLAAALQGDDWMEDHGMHADDRATCHQCQSWADHAHDQITNRRITLEQWEGRAAPQGWDHTPGSNGDDTSRGRGLFVMPPAAQPYQPNTSAPRDTTSQPSEQGATDMNVPGSTAVNTVRDRWDQFFTWLFDWGGYNATARPNSPHAVADRVDAKLAEKRAIKSIPVAPEAAKRDDRRPQPEPQDLDALASTPPPPRPGAKFRPPPPKPRLNTWSRVERDWCSCEGNAHDARCQFASVRRLDVSGHFSPPPSSGASTEPAPTNQP